jgi:hypothetical protein
MESRARLLRGDVYVYGIEQLMLMLLMQGLAEIVVKFIIYIF